MARSRSKDPYTSRLAAAEVEASGGAQAQRDVCLAEVKKHPGKTAAEIGAATGLEQHAPSRRLPELREENLVLNGRSRICAVTRRLSLTWFPTIESSRMPDTGQVVQS